MCGICGYFSLSSPPPLEKMVAALSRRGPDGNGYYRFTHDNGNLGLGYARLAIVGLDSGDQPLYSLDRKKVLVCNGEIYNYQELKKELQAKGYSFYTESDCEVLLALYEEYGVDLLSRVNGMFSFALWDETKQSLLLARDRMGQKPLYYSQTKEGFLFGSEIKVLLQGGAPAVLDPSVLDAFLTTQVVPSGYSIFQNIFQLKPGHYGIFQQNKFETVPYFSLEDFSPIPNTLSLREALESSVQLRLNSEVPYGAFLSGGLDSTLMVALIRQEHLGPLHTFSIGFENPLYDELHYARSVSNIFKTQHHEEVIPSDAALILNELVEIFDEPFGDSSAIPCYYLSRLAKTKVKMVLTGDGGDELFYGYPRYQAIKLARYTKVFSYLFEGLIKKIPVPTEPKSKRYRLKKLLSNGRSSLTERYLRWNQPLSDQDKETLYTREFQNQFSPLSQRVLLSLASKNISDFALYDQQTYLPDDILVKVDRTSMAHGLECRSPFLDYRVVLVANRLREKDKLRGLNGKYILKKVFQDLIPEEIQKRKKMGFGVPIASWLKKEAREFCQDTLLENSFLQRGWFQKKTVEQWIEEHVSEKENHGERLWLLLNIAVWAKKYL